MKDKYYAVVNIEFDHNVCKRVCAGYIGRPNNRILLMFKMDKPLKEDGWEYFTCKQCKKKCENGNHKFLAFDKKEQREYLREISKKEYLARLI